MNHVWPVRNIINSLIFGALLCLCIFALPAAYSQSSAGTLQGVVKDDTGALIQGATITATSLETGQARTTSSDGNGNFTVPNLSPGHYSVTVARTGFTEVKVPDTEILVAQHAVVDAVMHVGGATDVVTVEASEAPLLAESVSSVGQVINTDTVQDMPLNGRNFWQLTQLTPGVNYIQGGQNIAPGGTSIRASAVNVNVNGLSSSWTGWYLDGANVTEGQLGGTIISPNVDALQEFKVESGNMGADYGHSPTIINATLKSGGNQFHGSGFEFVRNNSMDAANYFFVAPAADPSQRDEPLHRNQFGFAVGGPIRKDKTFFFIDAQETLLTNAQDFSNIVPTDAERGGDFSASSTVIKNPISGTQVSSNGVANVIPAQLLANQPATYFMPWMPHANKVVGGVSYAEVANELKQQLGLADLRVDHKLAANDQLVGRYSIANSRETDPNGFPLMGSFPLRARGQDTMIRETHIFNQKWINEAQVSYYHSFFHFTSSLEGQNINDLAGIQGMDGLSPANYLGAPTVTITSYSTFNGQAGNSYPKQNKIRSYQYVDRLTYSAGKHNFRLGYELFHNDMSYIAGSISMGAWTFNDKYSGDNFADFLMGYPASSTRSTFRQRWGSSGNFHSMFAQDDYHITSNLTLNLGIRWEINPFYSPLLGQTTGFDDATGKVVLPTNYNIYAQPNTPTLAALFADRFETTSSLGLPENVRATDTHDVAPRLGLSYSPSLLKNTVIRGGYGMFYLFVDDNDMNNTQNSVPFIAQQSATNSAKTPTYAWSTFYNTQPLAVANPNPGQACSFGGVYLSCSNPAIQNGALHVSNTYIQEWNFGVQHQFGQKVSLDVAYVGNNTTHMAQGIEINDPNPGAGTVQNRRPYPQWGTVLEYQYGPKGHANYNALQAKLETRAYKGATALVSYTYGKCLANGTYSVSLEANPSWNYYGPCSYNLTQNMVTSVLYDLPFGKGKALLSHLPEVANGIVDNWHFSGIFTAQSGLPFTPTISTDNANTGVGSQRPELTGIKPNILKNPLCWFDNASNKFCPSYGLPANVAFAVPTQYTYGNGGIDTIKAGNLLQLDTTLMKQVHFTSERSLEFRVSFYNVFNHPTFTSPATNIDASSAGQVSATLNAARIGEIAAKFYF